MKLPTFILAIMLVSALPSLAQSADQLMLEQAPKPMSPEEVKIWGSKFLEETKTEHEAKTSQQTAIPTFSHKIQ